MGFPVGVAAETAGRVARELNVPMLSWRSPIRLDLGGTSQNLFSEQEVSVGRIVPVDEQWIYLSTVNHFRLVECQIPPL